MSTRDDEQPPLADEPDITALLEELRLGADGAADQLAAVVSEELHRIATNALRRERANHSLQPTELVDEAFVALLGQHRVHWQNRSHFYAVASQIIRRLLVDHARRKRAVRRDHGIPVTLDETIGAEHGDALDLIALDDALRQLEGISPRQGRVVELRFFAGLDVDETAEVLAISTATVKRDWAFARAFLIQALST